MTDLNLFELVAACWTMFLILTVVKVTEPKLYTKYCCRCRQATVRRY